MMRNGITILLVLLCLSAFAIDGIAGDCYEDWSRCSGWSSWATDILWENCNDNCIGKGKSGGSCVLKDSTCWFVSGRVYFCKCNRS
jgi:hypothetical protein